MIARGEYVIVRHTAEVKSNFAAARLDGQPWTVLVYGLEDEIVVLLRIRR